MNQLPPGNATRLAASILLVARRVAWLCWGLSSMGRKILLDRNLSGFAVLQPLLVAFGYEVETLADPDASVVPPVEGVAAIIIPMAGSGGWAAEVVNRFRQAGYQGIIGVAGIYTPEIDARCRLAEKNASFIPAMSGPIDTAMRIRRLLPPA